MPLELTTSQKGKPLLIIKGHLFRKEKNSNEKQIWRCVNYDKSKCKARCHTIENEIMSEEGEHNHVPDPAKIKAKEVIKEIKDKAKCTQSNPNQIIADVTIELGSSTASKLPAMREI